MLAIDPGNVESAFCLIDILDRKPIDFGKINNRHLRMALYDDLDWDLAVIELIGHYGTGMPAGQDVFDTCIWTGRFAEIIESKYGIEPALIKRATIKAHLCG